MTFRQSPPTLSHPYRDDAVLRGYLQRALPPDVLSECEEALVEMGDLAGGELFELQAIDRLSEPRLTPFDAWGNRIDRIEPTALWKRAEEVAAEFGLTAIPYEGEHGRYARVVQFALVYLYTPSSDFFSCPLAMTDAAARALLESGNDRLADRAVPLLTSRDPEEFWTSGQWMTESIGGSDVSRTETVARQDDDGQWRLYGKKWFTSAASSQMALTLARPEAADGETAEGGSGLALFYVETRDEEGRLRNIRIERLKEKLGTKKLPTAELTLDGTPAEIVRGPRDGVRDIAPMLNVTRVWNAVTAVSLMRRGLALLADYSEKREVFGKRLAEKPAFRELLEGLDAEFRGAFHLTFRVVELIGLVESAEGSEADATLLRLLTPIVKLATAKQAVAVLSEVVEGFGGAGYVEDTGIPTLLRDAQVLPIWEGTTDVLALDLLRVVARTGFDPVVREIERVAVAEAAPELSAALESARGGVAAVERAYAVSSSRGADAVEASARRFAWKLGRSLELAQLVRAAGDPGGRDAVLRFARAGVDRIGIEGSAAI